MDVKYDIKWTMSRIAKTLSQVYGRHNSRARFFREGKSCVNTGEFTHSKPHHPIASTNLSTKSHIIGESYFVTMSRLYTPPLPIGMYVIRY